MANAEQLAILKQGVEVWNKWRVDNPTIQIDLVRASLSKADLIGAGLSGAVLTEAVLSGANLKEATLSGANLSGAVLWVADLREANLSGANLRRAGLSEANLREANLREANLSGADLSEANLSGADLSKANLMRADLIEADLSKAVLSGTFFARILNSEDEVVLRHAAAQMSDTVVADTNLGEATGLEHIVHIGPSQLSTTTFVRSKGKIPEEFLRGCGLSDWEIEAIKLYNPDLSNEEITDIQYKVYMLRATQALQISPLFISYSHADSKFVDRVGASLRKIGIRYWRDIHDMKAGRMEKQIDRAIRQNPTVLLILSEHSLGSDWVQHEVRTARELEKGRGSDVLCPVALDDSWKSSHWPKRIMEQIMEYNILDFSEWQDKGIFEKQFRKLIEGLHLFYKR